MRHLWLFPTLLILPVLALALAFSQPATAQTPEEDRSFLQGLIEDNLSGTGRDVRIVGFQGALSSQASIAELTIADGEGVWLRLTDLVLNWNRSALLRGRIDVTELTVAEIELIRPPVPDPSLPAAEASSGFSLPELPVSVQIGRLAAEQVSLGAAVMGQAISFQLDGSAALADGQGSADLTIERTDGLQGRVALAGAYDNSSRNLALDLTVEEEAGGIISTLAGLPDAPSLELTINGDAPVDDFTANLTLATDDADRLSGLVTVQTLREAAPVQDGTEDSTDASEDEQVTTRIVTDISGDIAPLFAPEYRAFFGPDIQLAVSATRTADRRLLLEGLELTADAIRLNGSAEVGADGFPERIALTGRIASNNGAAVLLPLSGPETRLDGLDLDLSFDAETGDTWTLDLDITGLDRPDLRADRAQLTGQGLIARAENGAAPGLVNGQIRFVTDALATTDAALAAALGGDVTGALQFEWTTEGPFRIPAITLDVADTSLRGDATITMGDGETALSDLRADFDLALQAGDLARFAGLSGQDLAGAADVGARGSFVPLTGAFTLDLTGTGQDLQIGQDRVDPLITGASNLVLRASRDETGTRIEQFEIVTTGTDLRGQALLGSAASSVDLTARLQDIGLILDDVAGPVAATLTARQQAETWQITLDAEAPGATTARVTGSVTGDGIELLLAEGQITANLGDLSVWSTLAGRPLGGAAQLTADLAGNVLARSGTVSGRLDGTDLALGQANADAMLRGASSLIFDLAQSDDGMTTINQLDLATPQITADLAGRVSVENLIDSELRFDAAVREIGTIVPELSGPVRATGNVLNRDGAWRVDARASGPGEASLVITGAAFGDGVQSLQAEGEVTGRLGNLSAYSRLAGRNLRGAADLTVTASGDVLAQTGTARGRLDGNNLAIGQPTADALLRGASSFVFDVTQTGEGVTLLEQVELRTPQLSADVSGRYSATDSRIAFDADLRNIGLIAPDISGPASASGVAQTTGGDWRIEAQANGPGGITIRTNGTATPDFQRLNMSLQGNAPLSLANARLRPNSISGPLNFDLAVNGPPALSSVTGTISTSGTRVVLPGAGLALADLGATIRLSGGTAQVAAQTSLPSGGTIALSGPVTLSGAYPADLTATINGATLRQRNLYETTANGQVTLRGPLTGGAQIGGTINLGVVELRIPEGRGPTFANLPDLRHQGESADSRRTRLWAGMIADPNAAASSGPGVAFPIDLTINAPSRIFVRGRGLDAELGGQLRLTGTTANLIPQGQFDLVRGRFNILGQRLDLTRGLVSLQGAFDPFISFVAETQTQGSTIQIGLEGVASEPELLLSSSPELPEDEVLALLLFGRGITDISALQAVQLAGAIRTLSGRGSGLGENLRDTIGVDDLDLTTTDSGETEARVGRYLSENIYSDVTVNTSGETQINLNLNVTDSITVRGRVNSDGGTGIGVYIERDY